MKEAPDTVLDLETALDPLGQNYIRGYLAVALTLTYGDEEPYSLAAMAQTMSLSEAEVDQRRQRHEVLGIRIRNHRPSNLPNAPDGTYAYPAWQIGLSGLPFVLAKMTECGLSPYQQLEWLVNSNDTLEADPIEALRQGRFRDVLLAVEAYAERWA